jgi:uncharacterized protein (DUF305 family)
MKIFRMALLAVVLLLPAYVAAQTPDEVKQAFMEVHHKMMAAMNITPTGQVDRDFAAMMTPHHQGAIDMAEIQLRYGKDPELRKLAEEIIAAQKKEIAILQGWLAKNP